MTINEYEFRFVNSGAETLILVLEPWAEEFAVEVKSEILIHIRSRFACKLEAEIMESRILVWAWSGCTATVAIQGIDVTPISLSLECP